MVEFTLFEVHLDGAEFTANAPFSSGELPEDAAQLDALPFGDENGESTGSDEESGSNPATAILGLAVLALVVVALRRVLGGSGEPILEETTESDAEERTGLRTVF